MSSGQKRTVEVEKLSEAELRELVPSLLHELSLNQQRIAELSRMLFGRKSEKSRDYTMPLFDDVGADQEKLAVAEEEVETVTVPAHERKVNKRRKDFPDHLPRRHSEFRLSGVELACPDCGNDRHEIGEETTQELERIEFVYVHVMVRKKYACRGCEGSVVTADGGQRVLPKCILGPGFLAQTIFERFSNHMPYARLEKKYRAEGLSIARSVLCSSVMRCAELLEPVYEAHKKDVLESLQDSVLQSDDTTIVQRNGPEAGQRKVHLWAWRDQHAGVFYTLSDHRNRAGPLLVLGDRGGRLQCDGHDCYGGPGLQQIQRIGCWAHVRRYFEKAKKSGDGNAQRVIDWIGKLFLIEREGKEQELDDAALVELRKAKSKPIIEAIDAWLDVSRQAPPSLPDGPLMKGVTYAMNQWSTLTRFLEDGRIREISNNGCERALRAPVIGRKNWAFFGSEDGAKVGVIMMSLVQSCREHGINPLLYLRDVLHLISTVPASQVGTLTPRGWKAIGAESERKQRIKDEISTAVQSLTF